MVFSVTLSTAADAPVTVDFATADDTASAGSDYQAVAGTLTFAPGETSKTIIVTVNGDRLAEPAEYVNVNLSNKNQLSFDARHSYRAQNKNNYFNNIATGNYLYRVNQGASLDDVYTISPSLVMTRESRMITR